MGSIDYRKIYEKNQADWKALTREPQKYEALLAGHYSDSNHFVYELLQNAEDERASKVVIEYYEDRLIFYHDGDPFNEDDVKGVSSMLMGTKDRNSGQTIGRFGMGFKSVFKYTCQPEIYSDGEAFRIENYLLPVEITEKWNYRVEEQIVVCKVNDGNYKPFGSARHLTKIVIPFMKRNDEGELYSISGKDVLEKLLGLNGEILLFLSHIRELYWTDKTSDKWALISLHENPADRNLVVCSIEGSEYEDREETTKYLLYKKVFDHPQMSDAEVSVAYKINSREDNINEIKDTDIWVYFPTRDKTKLPFLIHGSFETAVSREKLMTPSDFNYDLFDKLGDLIAESMVNLKERKLITQAFLRRILMQAFKDEDENETIPGLKDKINDVFLKRPLLPNRDGEYFYVGALYIPLPFRIAEYVDKPIFKGAFSESLRFVAFSNERESNFTEYYLWLRDDLGLGQYNLFDMANDLKNIEVRKIGNAGSRYENLLDFYHFCTDYVEKEDETEPYFSRRGPYEKAISECLSEAWKALRQAPIVLNAEGVLASAYSGEREAVYLDSSSNYKSIPASAIVNKTVTADMLSLFKEGFKLVEFDNFQYVKEKVLKKYAIKPGNGIAFETDNHTKEYVEDIRQLIQLAEDAADKHKLEEIRDMVKRALVIKIIDKDYNDILLTPKSAYVDISEEGIDQTVYYAPVDLDEEAYDFGVYRVDESFYNNNDISLDSLKKLGLITSPYEPGTTLHTMGDVKGWEYWTTEEKVIQGNTFWLHPEASIVGVEENIEYIVKHPEADLAKKKSSIILALLIYHSRELEGEIYRYKDRHYKEIEKANILKQNSIIMNKCWVYGNDGKSHKIEELSKYDLSVDVYGELKDDEEAYRILGFKITEQDITASAFKQVEALDRRNKMILFRQLARELGKSIGNDEPSAEAEAENSTFVPNVWLENEFPIHKVRDWNSLVRHVREQFYCADPVRYQEVLRSIRVSKSPETVRAYTVGMYTNEGQVKICQMCKTPADFVEAVEIANYGMELPQMHLCLCRNCSSKYKQLRDSDKNSFKEKIKDAFLKLDIEEEEDSYEIILKQNVSVHFTQTHIAEIRELLRLIDEYGLPNEANVMDEGVDMTAIEPLRHSIKRTIASGNDSIVSMHKERVIKDGSHVIYRKVRTGGNVDTIIQADKYTLHKLMIGKKTGDIVELMGKKYQITSIQ